MEQLFILLLHATAGLQPNETVTVQLQRVRVALALEEARKIAPLGMLSSHHLLYLKAITSPYYEGPLSNLIPVYISFRSARFTPS